MSHSPPYETRRRRPSVSRPRLGWHDRSVLFDEAIAAMQQLPPVEQRGVFITAGVPWKLAAAIRDEARRRVEFVAAGTSGTPRDDRDVESDSGDRMNGTREDLANGTREDLADVS